jgi:hypothetical protein
MGCTKHVNLARPVRPKTYRYDEIQEHRCDFRDDVATAFFFFVETAVTDPYIFPASPLTRIIAHRNGYPPNGTPRTRTTCSREKVIGDTLLYVAYICFCFFVDDDYDVLDDSCHDILMGTGTERQQQRGTQLFAI